MSGPNNVLDKGYALDPAISATQNSFTVYSYAYPTLFYVVKLRGTGAAGALPLIQTSTVSGEKVLGVVQEDTPAYGTLNAGGRDYANLGRVVNVRILGITRVVATGVIAVGSRVISNGDGTVVIAATATANQNIVGIALGAAAATGDQIDLLLTPGMQANNP
jgi:hypothetical protein